MDVLDLSRFQFASTSIFHFFFVSLTDIPHPLLRTRLDDSPVAAGNRVPTGDPAAPPDPATSRRRGR